MGRRTEAADRTVKDIRRQTRKRYSSEEKNRIVLAGLPGEDSIAYNGLSIVYLVSRLVGEDGLVLDDLFKTSLSCRVCSPFVTNIVCFGSIFCDHADANLALFKYR